MSPKKNSGDIHDVSFLLGQIVQQNEDMKDDFNELRKDLCDRADAFEELISKKVDTLNGFETKIKSDIIDPYFSGDTPEQFCRKIGTKPKNKKPGFCRKLFSWLNFAHPSVKQGLATGIITLLLTVAGWISAFWNVEYGFPSPSEIIAAEQGKRKIELIENSFGMDNFKKYWMGGINK